MHHQPSGNLDRSSYKADFVQAFKACAENGTHYFDVTGEVPYVARMIKKYESVAKQTGSMLFPEIGVESAPADIVAWSLAKHNRTQLDSKTGEVVMSVHKLKSVERVQLP